MANFLPTADNVTYGTAISKALGGTHFVIDTSRNGAAAEAEGFCNPPGRRLGQAPTLDPGIPLVDALLWIKRPGESDGDCGGGAPTAGEWYAAYALSLVGDDVAEAQAFTLTPARDATYSGSLLASSKKARCSSTSSMRRSAPGLDLAHERQQRLAERREPVVDADGHRRERGSGDDPVALQGADGLGEHLLADPGRWRGPARCSAGDPSRARRA